RFQREGDEPVNVDGFCDATDGTLFKVRYMPARPGRYRYSVTYRQAGAEQKHEGSFEVADGHRHGVLRVDRDHLWHFIWRGTGEASFFNGTTAYFLIGWEDEAVTRACLDRFQRYKINRVRVLLNGRPSHSLWGEPIIPGMGFQVRINPWPSQRPDHI